MCTPGVVRYVHPLWTVWLLLQFLGILIDERALFVGHGLANPIEHASRSAIEYVGGTAVEELSGDVIVTLYRLELEVVAV